MHQEPPRRILPSIVVSQFFCTSLWFAGNAVLGDIIQEYGLHGNMLADLTSCVQSGFITGTLFFALFSIADRFSPSRVFFICAIIAAVFNLGMLIRGLSPAMLLLFRFFTGFFLAGIYPVGMKIAADHFQKGLGKSLGFLVGALVLGTAFPHFIKTITAGLPWRYVIWSISILSVAGGFIMMLLVPDGLHRKAASGFRLMAFTTAFHNPKFRSAAFGYFGHMWELYTFWAFVPVMLAANNEQHHSGLNIPLLSFIIIAGGSIACASGGIWSARFGAKKIATVALFVSCCCCLLSPLFIVSSSAAVVTGFLFVWGLAVIADSPMFSTLVAQNVKEELKGTALTIVNCIGFSITILSIQFIKLVSGPVNGRYLYMLLAIGPVLGLAALLKNKTA